MKLLERQKEGKKRRKQLAVSSVLNRDKQFGKKHLTDGNVETCWNSEQGPNQFIIIEFDKPETISEWTLHFQGGFVGITTRIQTMSEDWITQETIHPTDTNHRQSFKTASISAQKFRLLFEQSSDFYGRITLYELSWK
ncbi:nuclear receptor 2C2-associated protein [Gorgonomyces haynaldii]|nr:nuclear receptor 2C2-associated protein [Gorgonomyces haynaldii]